MSCFRYLDLSVVSAVLPGRNTPQGARNAGLEFEGRASQ